MNGGSRCWANLPADALAYIINECSLCQSDVASVRLACMHWRSTTNSHLKSLAPACTSLEQVASIAQRFSFLTNCDLTRCDTRLVGHASLCRDASARLSTLLAALSKMPSLTSLHISDTFSERMGQKHWASLVCAQALVDVAQPLAPQPPLEAPPQASLPLDAREAGPSGGGGGAASSFVATTVSVSTIGGGTAALASISTSPALRVASAASSPNAKEGAMPMTVKGSSGGGMDSQPPPSPSSAPPAPPLALVVLQDAALSVTLPISSLTDEEHAGDDESASASGENGAASNTGSQRARSPEVKAPKAAATAAVAAAAGKEEEEEDVEEFSVVMASQLPDGAEAEAEPKSSTLSDCASVTAEGRAEVEAVAVEEVPLAAGGADSSGSAAEAVGPIAFDHVAEAAPVAPPPLPLVLDAAELSDPGIKSFTRAISRPGATHQHAFWLPDWCGRLAGLQELHIRGRQRPSTGLPPCLLWLHAGRTASQLTSLSLVRLSLVTLPEQLQHLTALTRLVAQDCSLSLMPRGLASGLPRLQYMDLSLNGLTALPQDFTQLTSLKHLDLQRNKLVALPADIGRLSGVTCLLLNNNQLRQLPASLAALRGVEVLSCSYNWLGGMGPSLPLLCSLPRLRRLELACVSDVRCRLVPPQELRLLAANLYHLDLAANNLVPADVLGTLTSVRSLVLSDCGLLAVPPWVRRLAPSLQYLDLSNNSLSELPTWLAACTRLRYLSIAHNRLSLRVPPAVLEQMPQLEVVESE